jgi:hypothetical protein
MHGRYDAGDNPISSCSCTRMHASRARSGSYYQTWALPKTFAGVLSLVLCHRILCTIERFQALCTTTSPRFPSYTVILGCLITALFAHTLRVHTDTAAGALQHLCSILSA